MFQIDQSYGVYSVAAGHSVCVRLLTRIAVYRTRSNTNTRSAWIDPPPRSTWLCSSLAAENTKIRRVRRLLFLRVFLNSSYRNYYYYYYYRSVLLSGDIVACATCFACDSFYVRFIFVSESYCVHAAVDLRPRRRRRLPRHFCLSSPHLFGWKSSRPPHHSVRSDHCVCASTFSDRPYGTAYTTVVVVHMCLVR